MINPRSQHGKSGKSRPASSHVFLQFLGRLLPLQLLPIAMCAFRADLRPEREAKQSGLPGVCEAPDAVAAARAREAAASIQLSLDLQAHSLASLDFLAEVRSPGAPLGLNAWSLWARMHSAMHMKFHTRLVFLRPSASNADLECHSRSYICGTFCFAFWRGCSGTRGCQQHCSICVHPVIVS